MPMFVIARKTKCDGLHPACSSCIRRSLPCNYVHDGQANGTGQKRGARRASTSKIPTGTSSSHSHSPSATSHTTTHLAPTPSSASEGYRHRDSIPEGELELKRSMDDMSDIRPIKKMKLDVEMLGEEAN